MMHSYATSFTLPIGLLSNGLDCFIWPVESVSGPLQYKFKFSVLCMYSAEDWHSPRGLNGLSEISVGLVVDVAAAWSSNLAAKVAFMHVSNMVRFCAHIQERRETRFAGFIHIPTSDI